MDEGANNPPADVRMYTLPGCVWCGVARRRLRRHGIDFEEIPADTIKDYREFLSSETGGSTVPQILIDGVPIGGSDDLARLDRSGALLPRIKREEFPLTVKKRRFGILGFRHYLRTIDEDGRVLETGDA